LQRSTGLYQLVKTFTNHAHWVIGEPGWVEIADDVAEWLISTTTCKTPDVHGSTNVPVGNALGVRGDMDIKDAYMNVGGTITRM